ncbi:DUF6387 family protein [Acinetobacter bohemicus]|uniref:DUF6387 family protein n=1 Tax=Acinetobacter sp. S4397-1 TaxID=2972915 RepID=UPI00209AE3C8|nr:DUF6387 family protein [Acinetobacter sp. S4397-1]MCO8044455.1 DUF6387 family protein [Acinetobacter sp. S4397-1]
MAYIKFKTDMPEWFVLEKYIENQLNATEILPNLIYRKILHGFLTNRLKVQVVNHEHAHYQNFIFELKGNLKLSDKKFFGNSETIRQEIICFMFTNLQKNPLKPFDIQLVDENPLIEPIDLCFSIFMNGFIQHTETKPIKELTAIEVARNYFALPQIHRNFIKSEILAFGFTRNDDNEQELLFAHEDREGLTREIVDDCRGSLFSLNVKNMKNNNLTDNPLVEVNLNFTNAFLLRQFEQWLNRKRMQVSNNNISYEEDLLDADPNTLVNKINEYRIFAYLDLYFWQAIEKHKIKKSVFAISLFPNGEKGESVFKNLDENFLPPLLIYSQSKEMRRLVSLYNLEKIDL